jgi:hypothetical protein
MIKKKMHELITRSELQATNRFEVIVDMTAAEVIGGSTEGCTNLQKCGTFKGSCGALYSCGTYSES